MRGGISDRRARQAMADRIEERDREIASLRSQLEEVKKELRSCSEILHKTQVQWKDDADDRRKECAALRRKLAVAVEAMEPCELWFRRTLIEGSRRIHSTDEATAIIINAITKLHDLVSAALAEIQKEGDR